MPDRARRRRPGAVTASIRFRVAAIATVAVFAVLAASSVTVAVVHRQVLRENLDETVRRRMAGFALLVAQGGPPSPVLDVDDDDSVAQIVGPDGRVVAATPAMEGAPPLAWASDGGPRVRQVRIPGVDDAPFRSLSQHVTTSGGDVVIHVAEPVDDVDESSAVLVASLGVVVPATALLLGFVIWWAVGRTLRPVEAVRAEVADITGSDLHRRVPEPASRDEIGRLARTMNAMLGRVEDATKRQQRFVADAAHELRSPLTQLRSEVEVDLAYPAEADLAATHRSVLETTTAMQRLVEDLLHLARSDAGVAAGRVQVVDLDDLVLGHVRRHRAEGRVELDATAVSAGQVDGDPEQLGRAVGNLIENAGRHARRAVTLSLREDGDQVVLTVDDDGPGIPPDLREQVFERFARLDDSRTRGTGGTGLGLAIVRDIVHRHGGTVAVAEHRGPGARFVVTLPAHAAPTATETGGDGAGVRRGVSSEAEVRPDDRRHGGGLAGPRGQRDRGPAVRDHRAGVARSHRLGLRAAVRRLRAARRAHDADGGVHRRP